VGATTGSASWESEPAFVRAPEGNGCVERAIRTLKEQFLRVKSFETLEELRLELQQWAEPYDEQWLIERHGFRPPAQRRRTIALRSKSWLHDE
jgi:putative transposase